MSPLNFKIRKIRKNDIKQVVDIIQLNFKTVNSKVYPPEVIEFMCSYYNRTNLIEIIEELTDLYVAEDFKGQKQKEILGVGGWQLNQTEGIVRCMFIDPILHGNGIGQQILKKIEKTAKSSGIEKLTLNSSLNAVKFYKKAGYLEIETQDRGKFGNIILMVKNI